MTKVGIVILNYNDYDTTYNYINNIKDYKVLKEIVIVDNNSSDDSYNKLKKLEDDKIKVIKTDKNKGYAYGNNYGINYLDKNINYVIVSNPDIEVSEKTIKKLKSDLDNNEDIALISPTINQNGEIIKGWRLTNIKDEILLNINYFHRRVTEKLRYSEEKYDNELTKVDVVSGCFFMVRRDIFNLIGKFDDNTFLYYEENIVATKLKNINKNIYIDNNLEVKHNLSISVDKTYNNIKKYKMLKNSQKYYAKYYLKANKFQIFILRLTYYISLIIAFIISLFRRKK